MDTKGRWQALQARLTAARTAFDAGDRVKALEYIDAALELDPNFLAAQSLRERILTCPAPRMAAPSVAVPAPQAATTSSVSARPLVSAERYATFEQRAKRRRVDRRLDAARSAIQQGRLREAAIALDEVRELDPNLPDLAQLTTQFDELRGTIAAPHRGPWLAAAAVFAITVLGATWLEESRSLVSRAFLGGVPLVAAPTPIPPTVLAEPDATIVGTAGERERVVAPYVPSERAANAVEVPAEPPVPPRNAVASSEPASDAGVPAPRLQAAEPRPVTAEMRQPVPEPRLPTLDSVAASAIVVPASIPSVPRVDDDALIKQVLQRYRNAYEKLDAQSAQAVYPAVNEAALARAFDGLSSQSLTFEGCDVRLKGGSATATCRGSARYVPKVGSREPRTEPRVWTFNLAKLGNDWKIENARAER